MSYQKCFLMLYTMIGSHQGFQEKQIRWTGQILAEQFGHAAQNPWKTRVTPAMKKHILLERMTTDSSSTTSLLSDNFQKGHISPIENGLDKAQCIFWPNSSFHSCIFQRSSQILFFFYKCLDSSIAKVQFLISIISNSKFEFVKTETFRTFQNKASAFSWEGRWRSYYGNNF